MHKFICSLSLILTISLYAKENIVKKYRNYTPQQIQNLPQKTRQNVPIMYLSAANEVSDNPETNELLFGMYLNSLMYPGLVDCKTAIKSFQKDLNEQPTGILTIWQLYNLQQRYGMQKIPTIFFPNGFSSFKTDDYAKVEGTMIIIDDKIANPINHIEIECSKSNKECKAEQIDVYIPHDSGSFYSIMKLPPDYYDIINWNEDNIDATYRGTGSECRTTSLNFNFKTKEFYFITRNLDKKCEVFGVTFEKLSKPRISQIVDGTEIINNKFAEIQKMAYDVLSSDFKRNINKFLNQENEGIQENEKIDTTVENKDTSISEQEDTVKNNDFSLREAALKGDLDRIKFLLEEGADIHASNDRALKWASMAGHLDVVKLLVEEGANIHAESNAALRWAENKGHTDVVKYLRSLE
jgi:hypothetical protein